MSTLTAAPPATTSTRLATIGAAVQVFACLVLSYFDFFVTTSDGKFASTADYLYTIDGFPFVIGMLLIVVGLRTVQHGRDGTLGRIGAIVTSVGLVALVVTLFSSLITKDTQALGPVYVLGTFATFIGLILFAIACIRARVLPWWAGPALAVTWIVGGTVGDDGPLGFKASSLLLAAAAIAAAAAARRVSA